MHVLSAASSELPTTGIRETGDSCYTGLDAKFQLKINRCGGSASYQIEDILGLCLYSLDSRSAVGSPV